MTVENQIAPTWPSPVSSSHSLALRYELVVSHGNGPQIGLLALEGAAYKKVPAYPLDVLGAETQGMVGYLLELELANLLPADRRLAVMLTMIEVDPSDPAFDDPTKPIGPIYEAGGGRRVGGRARLDVPSRRQTTCGAWWRRRRRDESSRSGRSSRCSMPGAPWSAPVAVGSPIARRR